MATILQYRRPAEPAPRLPASPDQILGQVIIFPGVRIERYTTEEAPSKSFGSARKPAHRRKKQRR